MTTKLSRSKRLTIIITISACFFVAEISVGFYTRSLALVADAFHYLNDLIGFIVALVALKISQRPQSPQQLSFGWQRAQLLGAFFNGVFLLALGVSIFLQSIERFVAIQEVQNPEIVLIVACIGFGLNVVSAIFIHEHNHSPSQATGNETELQQQQRSSIDENENEPHAGHRHNSGMARSTSHDFGMMGVLLHIIGDAANNIGVIIAAAVIWRAKYKGRFYADPGVSMGIAILILMSSIPLVKNTGSVLLETAPTGVDVIDVKHDLERIPGIVSVHELHVWRLNQEKSLASTHILVADVPLSRFMRIARHVKECFHAYGIHSSTIQPELQVRSANDAPTDATDALGEDTLISSCQINCGPSCENLSCCT